MELTELIICFRFWLPLLLPTPLPTTIIIKATILERGKVEIKAEERWQQNHKDSTSMCMTTA